MTQNAHLSVTKTGLIMHKLMMLDEESSVRLAIPFADSADVVIPLDSLTRSSADNLSGYFRQNFRSITIDDTDSSNQKTVLFSGPIDSVSLDENSSKVTVRAIGFLDWLSKVPAMKVEHREKLADPDAVWTLTGTRAQIVSQLLTEALRDSGNYSFPRSVVMPTGGTGSFTHTIQLSEVPSVADVLNELQEKFDGFEIVCTPRYKAGTNNKTVEYVINVGAPHFRKTENAALNIDQGNHGRLTFSFNETANDRGNWWFGQSNGETFDLKSKVKAKPSSDTEYLSLYNKEQFNSALTAAELDAQLDARVRIADILQRTYTITAWNETPEHVLNLGKVLIIRASRKITMNSQQRLVGVSWQPNRHDSWELIVMPKDLPVFPRVPNRLKDFVKDEANKVAKDKGWKTPKIESPDGGGGIDLPTFDDWDKKPKGDDSPPPIKIKWAGLDWSASNLAYSPWSIWGPNSDTRNNGEGHAIYPDEFAKRFISVSTAHVATMWKGKEGGRGTTPPIYVKKSKKFVRRPVWTPATESTNAVLTDAGVEGEGGVMVAIRWEDHVSPVAMNDTYQNMSLQYEVFNFISYIKGPAGNRTVVLAGHQLQLFSDDEKGHLRSKNFAWEWTVDADYNVTSDVALTQNHIFNGNSGYDGRTTFYAYGNQIASDTSGDITDTYVMTPRGYPTSLDVEKVPVVVSTQYFKDMNMGQYATMNITLRKDWNTGTLDSYIGPDTEGEGYDSNLLIPIPGIPDYKRRVHNTYSCDVIDGHIYAASMTAYGKKVTTSSEGYSGFTLGERKITRSRLNGPVLESWTDLFSGVIEVAYGNNNPRKMNMMQTGRRTNGDIIFSTGILNPKVTMGRALYETNDGKEYLKQGSILSKNSATSVRQIEDVGMTTPARLSQIMYSSSFRYGEGDRDYEPFSDFWGFDVAGTGVPYAQWWMSRSDINYAIFTWGRGVSNYSQTYPQWTISPRQLKADGFMVAPLGGAQPLNNGFDEYMMEASFSWRWEDEIVE